MKREREIEESNESIKKKREEEKLSLPTDIFSSIFSFLKPTEARKLAQTSKPLREISKEIRTLNLNEEFSRIYAFNEDFRNKVKGRVLSINLTNNNDDEQLNQMTDISFLRDIPNVTLSNLPMVTDVSALEHAQSVTLDRMYRIEDVSLLANVNTVTLKYMMGTVVNLRTLTNVKNLVISEFTQSQINHQIQSAQNNEDFDHNRLRREDAMDGTIFTHYYSTGFEFIKQEITPSSWASEIWNDDLMI
jgi:hypothetical protein